MAKRRREVTADEAEVWRQAMRGTKPFPDRVACEPPAPVAGETLPPPPVARSLPPPTAIAARSPDLDHGRSPGLDKRTRSRLQKGEMAIDAVLDLHGLTLKEAHASLLRFVVGAAEQGHRCLLVITGKGSREHGGLLKAEVPRWLNEAALRAIILAFSYAQAKHGGEGALYVLLRRRR